MPPLRGEAAKFKRKHNIARAVCPSSRGEGALGFGEGSMPPLRGGSSPFAKFPFFVVSFREGKKKRKHNIARAVGG